MQLTCFVRKVLPHYCATLKTQKNRTMVKQVQACITDNCIIYIFLNAFNFICIQVYTLLWSNWEFIRDVAIRINMRFQDECPLALHDEN